MQLERDWHKLGTKSTGWPSILGYTGDTGIYRGSFSYWDHAEIHNFLSTILGDMGFSEIVVVATNLYTGWPLFKFEPLLKFEEPSHVSSNSHI